MADTPTPPTWYAELLTQLTVASGIGYVAAAYVASLRLTRGAAGKPSVTPLEHGLPCEALECRTEDGYRLAGWLIEPPHARATVALFHGMHQNRGQTLGRILFLAKAGYRCVAFDLRAHGESSGRRISFGYFESRDVDRELGQLDVPTWLMDIVWYGGGQSWYSLLCDIRDVAVRLWAIFPL